MSITSLISNKEVKLSVTNSKYKPCTVCLFTNFFTRCTLKNCDSRPISKNIKLFLMERKMT